MDVRQYLHSKGYQWTEAHRPSGINAIMNCPFCDPPDTEKKFAINLDNGAFQCAHKNRCGVSGSWYEFQKMHNDKPMSLDDSQRIRPAAKKEYILPKPRTFKMPSGKALKFLTDRGFTDETIHTYKLAQTQDGKEIAIPYYREGRLMNIKYRSVDGKKFRQEKGAEPTLWNRDNIPVDSEDLIITEGEFDAAAMGQYGFDAVSIPGGVSNMEWIETEWKWLNKFKKIVLCFDMDAAGETGTSLAVKRLGEWRCKRARLPWKDANLCLQNGVSKEDVAYALISAEDFKPAMLLPASDFTEEVIKLIENPSYLQGTPTAFSGLDKYLGGWREGEMTVWSGSNGSGKSTILNQEVLNLASRGISSCIASLEMRPARYLRWAMVQFVGKQYPDKQEVRDAMKKLGQHLYVIDSDSELDMDVILDIFKYAARRYGVKHFIIDSLMRVKINEEKELAAQKSICNKFITLAKEFKAHAHLVAHPRKGGDDDERPGKVDIKGSGHITNIADNVLIMWRPSEELKAKSREKGRGDIMDAKLYIKKNRELGTEGSFKLWFDPATKRFSEV